MGQQKGQQDPTVVVIGISIGSSSDAVGLCAVVRLDVEGKRFYSVRFLDEQSEVSNVPLLARTLIAGIRVNEWIAKAKQVPEQPLPYAVVADVGRGGTCAQEMLQGGGVPLMATGPSDSDLVNLVQALSKSGALHTDHSNVPPQDAALMRKTEAQLAALQIPLPSGGGYPHLAMAVAVAAWYAATH